MNRHERRKAAAEARKRGYVVDLDELKALAAELEPGEKLHVYKSFDEAARAKLQKYVDDRVPYIQQLMVAAKVWVLDHPLATPKWQPQPKGRLILGAPEAAIDLLAGNEDARQLLRDIDAATGHQAAGLLLYMAISGLGWVETLEPS